MTKKERVLAAIRHEPVDYMPRGELAIQTGFLNQFLNKSGDDRLSSMAREQVARERLHMDLVNIHEFPRFLHGYDKDGFPIYQSAYGDLFKETPQSFQLIKPAIERIEDVFAYETMDVSVATAHGLRYFRDNSDFFLMAQIGGPVSSLDWALGMEDYMCFCMEHPEKIAILAGKIIKFEIERAMMFLREGAEAILIADDIAYNSGLLLPPYVMEVIAYPFYREMIERIKSAANVPVFLHTDGYVMDALPEIVACGFDGLHSIQPSAGMDIMEVKRKYGSRLCLMGNIDLNYLLPFGAPEEVATQTERLLSEVGAGSGFILSTCNILTDAVPAHNAIAMYEAGLPCGALES